MSRWALCLLLFYALVRFDQQGAPPAAAGQQAPSERPPALSHRPAPSASAPEGKIKLDVLVTDGAGQPVSGLQRQDFTLLDDKKPQPILSFSEVNGVTGNGTAADPPVEVILLIDATNNSLHKVAYERSQIEGFLRQNGGRLTQPVSLMIFSERGVKAQPQASSDGNQLAEVLEKAASTMHVIPMSGGYDAIERLEQSLRTLRTIAAAEGTKPGRKMLIWIGPGWPMLEGPGYRPSDSAQRRVFNIIVETTRALREARITMYSINPVDPEAQFLADRYRDFLKGVSSPRQAESGALAVPVFAIHSGGRAFDRPADLTQELNSCVAEAKAYYTLGFDPPNAERTDEYHDVEVKVDQPHLKARTNIGYYAEPALQP